jgi:flagellar basal-body rod protein FlgB
MMSVTFADKALGGFERNLNLRAKRVELLSQNIANADTPNYRARDLDFKSALASAQSQPVRATHRNHIATTSGNLQAGVIYTQPLNASADGNTVEISVEQAKFGQASADYQATLRFLESRVSGIRKALKGE